jgi:hypothetical protein
VIVIGGSSSSIFTLVVPCLSQSFNACDMFGWCRDWPTGQKHTQKIVAIGWGGFGNFTSKIIM